MWDPLEDPGSLEKKITGLVNRNCEPVIPLGIERVVLEGAIVTVVNVEEGKDKPYLLIEKSAYTRVGKDDRPFRRHDFDEIMNKRLAALDARHLARMPLEDEI